jgi:ectoine hydroxylase-related dioxygenase (phytanoyl-CoA dioxygenase family)
MRTEIAGDRIDAYRRDGYLAVDGFLDPPEVALLETAIAATLARIGRDRVVGNPDLAEPEGYRHRVVVQRLNLWKIDPTVRRFFLDPALGRMLSDLEGIDGLRMWHDQTFFKPPWGEPTAFHHDLPNWSFTADHGVQIWIALDPMTVENGCLHYLPGSHRIATADRTAGISGDVGAIFTIHPELAEIEPRAIEIDRGSAIIHNGLTVHGAGANMTPRWRRAMTCQYMPDGARFNGTPCILSRAQIARLSIGDLLDDEAHNPLVFRRERARGCPQTRSPSRSGSRSRSSG